MMKTLVVVGALWIGFATGCADFRDGIDDSLVSIKARTAAATAWSDSTEMFGGIDDEHHFGDGFKAGYFNATKYGPESRPLMPRRYSGRAFRSRRGQQRLQAWIDGFAHGTSIATEELIPDTEGNLQVVGYEARIWDAIGSDGGESQVSDTASGSTGTQSSSEPTMPATAKD
jgi:hypothetical protein